MNCLLAGPKSVTKALEILELARARGLDPRELTADQVRSLGDFPVREFRHGLYRAFLAPWCAIWRRVRAIGHGVVFFFALGAFSTGWPI